MREAQADLWNYFPVSPPLLVHCITTNGFLKNNGDAVMGRGVAFQAAELMPCLPRVLGSHIRLNGNVVMGPVKVQAMTRIYRVLTFPVKHQWFEKADMQLVSTSTKRLIEIAEDNRNMIFLLPRPGCGNGQLDYKKVRPLLVNLPDNVIVISKEL